VRKHDHQGARRRRQDAESGQAMVEFALILLPLLLLVAGIIQFGIALNYWLDMQRIANQGARWAAVDCGQKATTPLVPNPCSPSLQQTLKDEALSNGLEDSVNVEICYPTPATGEIGDPVKVRLETDFKLLPILGVGTITLGADATMRLEQPPDDLGTVASC
jgi:TadE-like protein